MARGEPSQAFRAVASTPSLCLPCIDARLASIVFVIPRSVVKVNVDVGYSPSLRLVLVHIDDSPL